MGCLEEKVLLEINKFREEREWKKFHNAKDLAISLSIETSELLECFQWKDREEVEKVIEDDVVMEKIKDEIADISIYLFYMVNDLQIDLEKVILEKVEKNKKKYPVDKCKGSNRKYTEL